MFVFADDVLTFKPSLKTWLYKVCEKCLCNLSCLSFLVYCDMYLENVLVTYISIDS